MNCASKWVFAMYLWVGCAMTALPVMGQKAPPPQNVLVVNGSGQPVPTLPQGTTSVAGTVNIGNTPNVAVANTPSVTVANSPSVNVANTPTVNLAAGGSVSVTNLPDSQSNPTLLATMEGSQVYEDTCSLTFGGSNSAGGTCTFHPIPSGKRLVIQEFDSLVYPTAGVRPIVIGLSGITTEHVFPAIFMGTLPGTPGNDYYAAHQATHVYTGVGATPSCLVALGGGSNTGGAQCDISGFLIDTF